VAGWTPRAPLSRLGGDSRADRGRASPRSRSHDIRAWWTLVSTEPLLGGTELKFRRALPVLGRPPRWCRDHVGRAGDGRRRAASHRALYVQRRPARAVSPGSSSRRPRQRVSFVYRGVRPNSPGRGELPALRHPASTASRCVRTPFAGLAHHVAGTRADLDEESWRAHVLGASPPPSATRLSRTRPSSRRRCEVRGRKDVRPTVAGTRRASAAACTGALTLRRSAGVTPLSGCAVCVDLARP